MIKTQLTSGDRSFVAKIVQSLRIAGTHKHPAGLMVYNHPFEERKDYPLSAENATFGVAMNKNALATGTPVNIHNGTDNTYWTASALSGTWVFNSTTYAYTGTRSIDATATTNNKTALFTRSTPLTFTGYAALSGAIYITDWSSEGTKNVALNFRLAGAIIGTTVNLGEYINTTTFGAWQTFNIPLTEFAIPGTTLDGFSVTTIDSGKGKPPDYYLDILAIQEFGNSVTYTIEPRAGDVVDIVGLSFIMVDNVNGVATVAGSTENATYPKLSYNKFGTITSLPNGIVQRRIIDNRVDFSSTIRTNYDILRYPDSSIEFMVGDGTNSMIKFKNKFSAPVRLYSTRNDRIEFIISDDLSSLLAFEIRAFGINIVDSMA